MFTVRFLKVVEAAIFGVGAVLSSLAHTAADCEAVSNSIAQCQAGKMHYDRYFNNYHEAAVYKIDIKWKNENRVLTTLDQAMDMIRLVHDFSGGLHQIVYLVGWQYDGHDSKYPSWSAVGQQCKSSFSDDPRESLRRMMREARKYNADVSLHINMNDAYTNSPLWQTYVDNGLINRDAKGKFVTAGVWGGERAYSVSHVKEWRSGFAQKRILGLLELLPELKDTHTIHIDALFGRESPYDGITIAKDIAAINRTVDYWHDLGFDVTTEFLPSYDQIGYFPMLYHLNLDERHKVLYAPSLICGGAGYSVRSRIDYYNKLWQGMMPCAGCIYEEAWGVGHWGDRQGSVKDEKAFLGNLFHCPILYAYYNRSYPVRHEVDRENYVVRRANGVVSTIRMRDRALKVTDNGRTVVEDHDFFLDLPHGGGTILAFSEKGCDRVFGLPPSFAGVRSLTGRRYPGGDSCSLAVENGSVRIALTPGTSLVLHK